MRKKYLVVRMNFGNTTRRIEAAQVKEEDGRLLAFDSNGSKVADLLAREVESWAFEEE
jgi:hypothetical protein